MRYSAPDGMFPPNALTPRQPELRAYDEPWYRAVPNALSEWMGLGPSGREIMRNALGPSNPLNIPAQAQEAGHEIGGGLAMGDYARAGMGGLGLAMAIGPGPRFFPRGVRATAEPPNVVPQGIRAYHGSPHDFNAERLVRYPDGRTEYVVGSTSGLPDVPTGATSVKDFPFGRFREDKIGTGEGAQAYGYGVAYVAESEGVARSYRDGLSAGQVSAGGRAIPTAGGLKSSNVTYQRQYDSLSLAEQMLADHNGHFDRAIRDLDALRQAKLKRPNDKFITNTADEYAAAAEQLRKMKTGEWAEPVKGRMYEVNINARPEDFLDWDKPLSQQPASIQSGVRKYMGLDKGGRADEIGWRNIADRPLDDAIGNVLRSDTSGLREAGIPGIRYKDAMSRGAEGGTSNYVVFDSNLISILRKYGLLPPAAAGAAAMTSQPNQEQ